MTQRSPHIQTNLLKQFPLCRPLGLVLKFSFQRPTKLPAWSQSRLKNIHSHLAKPFPIILFILTVSQSLHNLISNATYENMTNLHCSIDRASFLKLPHQRQLALKTLLSRHNLKQLPIKVERTTTKLKKSVRFANMATAITRSISKEELNVMWYDDKEYTAFQQERRNTIAAVSKANGDISMLDPTQVCVRGLEGQLSRKQVLARRMTLMQYTQVILRQQYVLKRTGRSDPERLQALSEMFSKKAGQRAHLRGIIDEALS